MTHIGIDLAWNHRARTGLAVVDGSGRLLDSTAAGSDGDIDAWLRRHQTALVNVAIDAPLIVRNATGMRPAERLIGAAFGRYDASCHASNTSKVYMNPPRAELLAQRHEWEVDPAHTSRPGSVGCIEVYPHPATIGLFHLGRILKYKSGPAPSRAVAFAELMHHLESLTPLALASNDRWRDIRSTVVSNPRPVDLDRVEDEVDAILCAYLAWLWHTDRDRLAVYGDVESGYIVAPPVPSHPASPRVPKPERTSVAAIAPTTIGRELHGGPAGLDGGEDAVSG